MPRLLVIGKRNGILNWYEDVLDAAPSDSVGFALTHNSLKARVAGRLFGKSSVRARTLVHDELAECVERFQPTLILIIDLFYLEDKVKEILSRSGARVAQWVGDRFEHRLTMNDCVNDFYFTDTGLAALGRSYGLPSNYLPLAGNPSKIPTLPWQRRKDSILFIGAATPERVSALEAIPYSVKVIGPNWPNLKNPFVSQTNRRISLLGARKLYATHRFVLNMINRANLVVGLPARCFDATIHGACLITDEVGDLSRNFVAGKEVIAYESFSDLMNKIREMKNIPVAEIAEAGFKRALRDHTFSSRIDVILNRLSLSE